MGKSFARSLDEARFTFFSEDLPKGDLIRYQQQLADCSPVRLLDLAALNKARARAAGAAQGPHEAQQRHCMQSSRMHRVGWLMVPCWPGGPPHP